MKRSKSWMIWGVVLTLAVGVGIGFLAAPAHGAHGRTEHVARGTLPDALTARKGNPDELTPLAPLAPLGRGVGGFQG